MKKMKYAIVYDSPTGNTKMLAQEIRDYFGEEDCVYFGQPGDGIPEADMIFAGFWTDKGDCSEKMRACLENLAGRRVFLFGTAGFGGAEEYFRQILERAAAHLSAGNTVIGTYMCQGKMPAAVRKRYEAALEKNPDDQKMQMMIENFDRALPHPDPSDIQNLRESLKKLNL